MRHSRLARAGCALAAVIAATGALPARAADEPLPVEMVTVAEAPVTLDMALTGTIEAADTVSAGFRQGGRIIDVTVKAGAHVSAGDELARTDSVQQQQALQAAQAALDSADAAREQAAQASDRAAAMLARGVGTRADRDTAAEALSTAQGAQERARSALDQVQRALDDTVLRAPFDGVVTARMADPGQIVGPAQPVLTIAARNGQDAVFQTPDVPQLRDAMGAHVALAPLDQPDRHMTGTVTKIAPLVDARTGSVAVRVTIDPAQADEALLGAAVRATIHMPAGRGIVIPWAALTATGTSPAVWLVGDDSTVSVAPVRIQRFLTGDVVVQDGLEPGQTIVGAGSQMLYPGRKVVGAQVTP